MEFCLSEMKGNLVFSKSTLHRMFARASEPQILFPIVTVFMLAVIWGATLGAIRVKYADARNAATASSRELLSTYEAQVVRALREIDLTLKLVKTWHELAGRSHSLADLQKQGLLPPDLIFTVSIADRTGNIVQSTQPGGERNIAARDYFREQLSGQAIFIGRPPDGTTTGARLSFSRRLEANGTFDGVAIVKVAAAYFVSGYEQSKLGQHGLLGLLGTDGLFRVKRTGDTVLSGDAVDYHSTIPVGADEDPDVAVKISSFDKIRRWTTARELYGFPLAVVVGISVDELEGAVRQDIRGYVLKASIATAAAVLFAAILGRTSWQLTQSRLRESESRIAYARRIEHLAYHDALTGLPNRSLFSKILSQGISEARRYERRLAVAFLDLDRFKQINDTLGHEAGDQLLREVADRLKGCVRESDTVARLGGDEFVLLLPQLLDEKYAVAVGQKILAAVSRPFNLISQDFRVTVSIGISLYPRDGLDEQTLTKNADIAMYQSKTEGRNNFQFYSKELNANSLERLSLESNLRHALERNEFELHYQAKRDIVSGQITGMEALLRWQHPDLGTVAPLRFIPVAEETGLIVPIGKWVLTAACRQNVAWQNLGFARLCIAVNLSERQFFDEGLLPDIAAILAATGMDATLLELEVTEGLLMHHVEKTLRILGGLKALGVRIAIDDFGVGYSSLAALQSFPLDTVKIDRSFIRDISNVGTGAALADAIIAMGKSLSLTVVAQGVETREQAAFLQTHACDELQGFYFKRPLPAGEFTQLLREQAAGVTFTGTRPVLRIV